MKLIKYIPCKRILARRYCEDTTEKQNGEFWEVGLVVGFGALFQNV